jgi:hypothetical protein
MVSDGPRTTALKYGYGVCFVLLLIPDLLLLAWILFASLASGAPRVIHLRTELLIGMSIATITYFRWPGIAVVVSWSAMLMILSGVLPWDEKGVGNFFFQFGFDFLFFSAANCSFVLSIALKRSKEV